MTKIALDTNILIYSHEDQKLTKRDIARDLLAELPILSMQVVFEYLNVMKRILQFSKTDLMELGTQLIDKCDVRPVEISTVHLAKNLIQKYDFQIFDSIIIASALEANCEILYSEDMQHNLIVNRQLKIINPYK